MTFCKQKERKESGFFDKPYSLSANTCHVHQEKNKLSEISQTYSSFCKATLRWKGKKKEESSMENANMARIDLTSSEVSQDFSVLMWPDSIQASFHNSGGDIKGGRRGTEQRSGPRAEIEKMKERLLWLQTVSNCCREEEGGQDWQNWREKYRKLMWRKAVLKVTAAVGAQKSMSFTCFFFFFKETS